MSDYIVCSPNPAAGLSNRIKCLITCMRWCDLSSRELALRWEKSNRFNCEFEDLFENKFIKNSMLQGEDFKTVKKTFANTWRLLFSPLQLDKKSQDQQRIHDYIDMKYNAISAQDCDEFLQYFNTLIPLSFIQQQVDTFSKKFDQNTISMAIRTWQADESRQHLFKYDRVLAIFEKYPKATFFVSCDNDDVLARLKEDYAERIINYPLRTEAGDRNSKEGIQDALIDLFLLSKNNQLMASHLSTFSEVAWWLGQCKAQVQII